MAVKSTLRWNFDRAFVLRTPLLPLATFAKWATGAAAASADELRATLRELVSIDAVHDALFVASPDLHAGLSQWRQHPDSPRGRRIEHALVRYVSRMAVRATPFGLFSGVTPGAAANSTQLDLAPRDEYERHTRLDNDYLFALTEALGANETLRAATEYRPNSSAYVSAGKLRYAEARVRETQRTYHLVAVELTDPIELILKRSADGATVAELAQALVDDDADIELAEAMAFIHELVDAQLLVSELAPPVTGKHPIRGIIDTLRETRAAPAAVDVLERVHTCLQEIDAAGLGAASADYQAVAAQLRALPAPVKLSRLFQVDMVKPAATVTLGANVLAEVGRAVQLLHGIAPRTRTDALARFRDAFVRRYQDRDVPLVEALDEESGIGFNPSGAPQADHAPLLADLDLPLADDEPDRLDERDAYLLRRVCEVVARGDSVLELTSRDLDTLATDEPAPVPDALGAIVTLVAPSRQAVARGRFRVLIRGASGPSGVRLSGRFCHAFAALHDGVRDHLRAEQALRPDAVFAEIAHLPEGRIGNILCRPVLRDYEIPFLGVSGAPRERHVPIQDLRVAVRGSRVVLRSHRLAREVIPRLTAAHNFGQRGLGVYRFLCALQSQDGEGPFWSWGPARHLPFLPRVTSGRLVFSRARWTLARVELEQLAAATRGSKRATTPEAVREHRARTFEAVQQLRAQRNLPRFVLLADHDNELPVDFDNILSVDSFAQLVRARPSAALLELFPGPGELVASGPEGAFSHELAVSFTRNREPSRGDTVSQTVRAGARSFPPGGEWVYAKLYCGSATADDVLAEVVAPLVRSASAKGTVTGWFFLRYADPEPHLRVRFRGEPTRLHSKLLPELHAIVAPAIDRGQVWRVQLDTYERELERYGGAAGIELAEQLFHVDSDAVLEIVELLEGDEGADARWRLALRGADMLLDDFGLDLAEKLAFARRARDDFANELHADTSLHKQLGAKFRTERASLLEMLARDPARDADSSLAPGFAILARRSERLRPIVEALRQRDQRQQLTAPLRDIMWSYIHMHINRLLRSAHRAQEMVIYDLLRRSYGALRARR